jgi:hypothetical protein
MPGPYIGHSLPDILHVVNRALNEGKQLQVNQDGSVQLASLGTRILRALNGFGQSADWRFQQQVKVADAVRVAIGDSVRAGASPGVGRYDKLFRDIQQVNAESTAGQLPVARYLEVLSHFDHKDTIAQVMTESANAAGAAYAAEANEPAQTTAQPTTTQDYRPLADVRSSLQATVRVEELLAKLDPAKAQPIRDELVLYRQATADHNVAADPAQRAAQAAILLTRLGVLGEKVDALVADPALSKAAHKAMDDLSERVEADLHLIGAVLANRRNLSTVPTVSWQQAIELRRLGIDLQPGLIHSGTLDLSTVKPLGHGFLNTVYEVKGTNGEDFVYKPGKPVDRQGAAVMIMAARAGAEVVEPVVVNQRRNADEFMVRSAVDMRYEARNVAASRLDELLGAGVIVRSQIAQVPTSLLTNGGVMVSAGQINTPGENAEAVSNQGLLMSRAPGMEARKLIDSGILLKIQNNGAFMRDLNSLALVDCLLCSMDRHSGNFHIDVSDDGTYRGLTGIDNDFSLQGADFDLKAFHNLSERDRQVLDRTVHGQITKAFKDVGLGVYATQPANRKAVADLAVGLPQATQTALLQHVDAYVAKAQELGFRHFFGSPEMQGLMHTLQMQARESGVPDDHPVGQHLARALEASRTLADVYIEEEQIVERQKAKGVSGADPLHNIGLPGAVDRVLAERVLAPDFESQMVQAYTGLLTPQEISKAVDRLHVVQDHLRGLESAGRLLNVDEWKAERVDRNGVRLDEIQSDPRHNHLSRMKERYEVKLADEAEKQAKAAAKAAAQAAAAAAAAVVPPVGPASAAGPSV